MISRFSAGAEESFERSNLVDAAKHYRFLAFRKHCVCTPTLASAKLHVRNAVLEELAKSSVPVPFLERVGWASTLTIPRAGQATHYLTISSSRQLFDHLQRCFRFGTKRVVCVDIDRPNDLLLIDYDAARDGQFPVWVSVGLFDIQTEIEIHLLQLVTESMDEVKLFSVRIVLIVKNLERQVFRLN